MADLKDRLRELRKKHKFTQKDLGDFIGISESAYGFYEQGRNEPSLETVRKLADKYNVSVAYIMGETDKPYFGIEKNGQMYIDVDKLTDDKPKKYDPLNEINKMLDEFGIGDIFFHDIEAWKNFTPEDVEELRKHFEWVAHKAKERNKNKD